MSISKFNYEFLETQRDELYEYLCLYTLVIKQFTYFLAVLIMVDDCLSPSPTSTSSSHVSLSFELIWSGLPLFYLATILLNFKSLVGGCDIF